jgi:hypothetical protein
MKKTRTASSDVSFQKGGAYTKLSYYQIYVPAFVFLAFLASILVIMISIFSDFGIQLIHSDYKSIEIDLVPALGFILFSYFALGGIARIYTLSVRNSAASFSFMIIFVHAFLLYIYGFLMFLELFQNVSIPASITESFINISMVAMIALLVLRVYYGEETYHVPRFI